MGNKEVSYITIIDGEVHYDDEELYKVSKVLALNYNYNIVMTVVHNCNGKMDKNDVIQELFIKLKQRNISKSSKLSMKVKSILMDMRRDTYDKKIKEENTNNKLKEKITGGEYVYTEFED